MAGHEVWWATVRRAALAAWLLLGVGLVAGTRWSYGELGWGGFWGWDPVENSGLLPWLAALAFLHAARRAKVDGQRQPSAGLVALAGVPFCFSLLGACLSRSGAAKSVHAFADARAVGRGLFLLLIVAVGILAWTGIRAARRQVARSRAESAPTSSAEAPRAARPQSAALAAGVVVLLAIAAVVAFGTVFPVLSRLAGAGTVDVTARYYATVVTRWPSLPPS